MTPKTLSLLKRFVSLGAVCLVLLGCQPPTADPDDAAPATVTVTASVSWTATTGPTATGAPTVPASLTSRPPSPAPSPRPTTTLDLLRGRTAAEATLDSLRRVDDYPLYTMRYYGPWEEAAAPASPDIAPQPRRAAPAWACSLFAALGDPEKRLFGRNFDWRYSPALLLFTDPPDGYASVSMVDLAYLVDPADAGRLTELSVADRRPLLQAPLWTFDGMNEHGLVVGMAAVPESEMPYDPSKPTIDSLGIIREMLDRARNVDEALAVLQAYTISWEGGPPLHYLIADAAGDAVLVEFVDGEMVLLSRDEQAPWHAATNHWRATVAIGRPSGCWRYDLVERELEEREGHLTVPRAMQLLTDVSQAETQWSVVYDLSLRAVHVVMGRAYDVVHHFRLAEGDG